MRSLVWAVAKITWDGSKLDPQRWIEQGELGLSLRHQRLVIPDELREKVHAEQKRMNEERLARESHGR